MKLSALILVSVLAILNQSVTEAEDVKLRIKVFSDYIGARKTGNLDFTALSHLKLI